MSRAAAAFLKATALFAALPAKEVEALATVAREEAHRARDSIFMEGDPALWFCLVKTGRVKIVRHSRTGKDVVLELLGPGEVFGGVAVIERRPYPAAAQALEPTVVLKIPADQILALAERYPSLIKELALTIGRRLRAAHDSVEALSVGLSIVELGLIYAVTVDDGRVRVRMTLTAAPGCPLPCRHAGVGAGGRPQHPRGPGRRGRADVFDPPWTPDRMVRSAS